ncbi:MAG: hypothetical protein MK214_18375 [Thalassotalea sp.]|nr:hypothetical protein [Thalassotalea sp.]
MMKSNWKLVLPSLFKSVAVAVACVSLSFAWAHSASTLNSFLIPLFFVLPTVMCVVLFVRTQYLKSEAAKVAEKNRKAMSLKDEVVDTLKENLRTVSFPATNICACCLEKQGKKKPSDLLFDAGVCSYCFGRGEVVDPELIGFYAHHGINDPSEIWRNLPRLRYTGIMTCSRLLDDDAFNKHRQELTLSYVYITKKIEKYKDKKAQETKSEALDRCVLIDSVISDKNGLVPNSVM